jgi:hypothetical protein
MNRLLVPGIALAIALGAWCVWIAVAEEGLGPAFIKDGGP